MGSRSFSLIVDVTSDWGIGYKNGLPWPKLKYRTLVVELFSILLQRRSEVLEI